MSRCCKSQAGFISYSLPELAMVMVVLGLVVITATTVIRDTQKVSNSAQSQASFQAIDHAVSGFIYAHGRLPCPAEAGATGVENCGLLEGVLPYQTLGMAARLHNQAGLEFRYVVFSDVSAKLNMKRDLIKPYYATYDSVLPPVAATQILGNSSDMDLCSALSTGWDTVASKYYANIIDGAARQHIAYVLADPGAIDADKNGNLFDGNNQSGVTFELPGRGDSSLYDDQVHTVYFDEIWEWLGCSGIVSAVSHAHPNVKSTTAILRQALNDYKVQLQLAVEFAEAGRATAAAQILQATAGLATAASLIPSGTATTLLMPPTGIYVTGPVAISLAVAAIVVNAVGVGLAATGIAYLEVKLLPLTKNGVSLIDKVIPILNTLDLSVETNVKAADQAAIYEK